MENGSGSVTLTFSMPNPVLPKFLAIKDCAKVLGVGYQTMYDIVKSETGPPYINLNGKHSIRIAYDDFMKWIDNHRKTSCTP